MSERFYKKEFDDATILKLEVFRRYIREWLTVFMTAQKSGRSSFKQINIYDFFSGPGKDAFGNPGSPLIIVDEIKKYCAERIILKSNLHIKMLFNDIDDRFIADLRNSIKEIKCDQSCCRIEYSVFPFSEALPKHLSDMNDISNANLVIMDQFGLKEVTPEVVRVLAGCDTTDIMFFISTSYIKRFIETPEIGSKYELNPDETKNIDYNAIHRYICDYYRERLLGILYYLSPFSIKKGGNIYGIIFGSHHILGLEKFLKVCWSLDQVTGEANYNIDRDIPWDGQTALFEEYNQINKIAVFEKELIEYISAQKPDNILLNEFCLTKGFSTSKSCDILTSLQKKGKIFVRNLEKNRLARKGSFYLGWNNCRSGKAKARYFDEATQ